MKRLHGKSILSVFLIWILAIGFTGCGVQAGEVASEDVKLKIVCTIFPQYDWTKQILGDRAGQTELTLLMKNGSDLHSYQPTVWDMVKISEADLFIYIGGESDFWVEDALANAKNPNIKALNLMEVLEDSVKEEEHVEGMQEVHGHEHEEEEHVHEEEPEYDEHIWLSLRNAKTVCEAITDTLCEMDAENSNIYKENCAEYTEKLHALDMEYARTVDQSSRPVLLFGDRFPFRYLADDYGLDYYAAFAGCSAETEASFETITFLAGKVGELKLPAVLAIDGSDQKIARTIADNTDTRNQKVLMLDSMQSVSEQDIKNGENYLFIMERNLEVLKEALTVT